MKVLCVLFFTFNILVWILAYPSMGLKNFLSIPSLILVLFPIYLAISYRHGWKSLFNFKFHTDVWVKNGKEQDSLLKTIAYTALMTGALGMSIGLVIQFNQFEDAKAIGQSFGPAMGISLLTSLYALLIFLIVVLIYFVGREDKS